MAYDAEIQFEEVALITGSRFDGRNYECALIDGSFTIDHRGVIDSINLKDWTPRKNGFFADAAYGVVELKRDDALYPLVETALYRSRQSEIDEALERLRAEAA